MRHSTDEELLMLVHGALSRGQATRVRAHLLLCPRCRARQNRLASLSQSLALTFRNPRLGVRSFRRVSRTALASVGILALLLTILGGVIAGDVAGAIPSAAASAGASHCQLAPRPPLPPAKKALLKPNLRRPCVDK